jgi:hypothetical protein
MAPRTPINFKMFYSFNYFEEHKNIHYIFAVITFNSFYIIAISALANGLIKYQNMPDMNGISF